MTDANQLSYRSRAYEDDKQRAELLVEVPNLGTLCVVTDPGGRTENQDAWGLFEATDGSTVVCVADGLGGHRGGRFAAQCAIEGVGQVAASNDFQFADAGCLARLFDAAQRAIHQQQLASPELNSMRSTLVVAVFNGTQVKWGHVGDVRFYLFRDQAIAVQTKDHSVPQMLADTGDIQPEEVRRHPDRSRLLQALGKPDGQFKMSEGEASLELKFGDSILLATDGFWEWVDENTMVTDLAQGAQSGLFELETKVRRNAEPYEDEFDNFTAMVLILDDIQVGKGFWQKSRFMPKFLGGKGSR
ncbi:MAG: serine/threonine-protein phosphatase [Idiomarina sp.]|nr:serine/threonine-protein phosphatase [Idiomarina sp.]